MCVMKRYIVNFTRNAIYSENGYLTVEAMSKKEAKLLAKEVLESGESVLDHDGDVYDLEFVPEQTLDDTNITITDVDIDDVCDIDYDEEGNRDVDDDYDECDNQDEDFDDCTE